MDEHAPPAHVLMVSFPGQGHLNPLLHLAKRIASKGLLVTFSSSSNIGNKIAAATSSSSVTNRLIRFEFFPDGWDDDDPRRLDLDLLMPLLASVGPPAITDLIRNQSDAGRPVSLVVNNPFLPWVLDVAEELSIPSAVLWVQSCAVFSTYYHYHHKTVEFPADEKSDISVILPGLPEMKADELPSFLLPSNPYKPLTEVILQQFHNLEKATWVLANSFEELELHAINGIVSPALIPVGPLVEMEEQEEEEPVRGDLIKADDCMEWLDNQQPRSVVYVSVGSIVVLSKAEMEAMAHGLVDSGRPFLWVVRLNCQDLLPTGFLDDREKKGMVVGWTTQERVLAHEAVGCFVTHCGWNSTLEAVAAGVPVVAYPQWGDQVPDAKFLVDVWGVGARMRAPAEREDVARCVDLMLESEGMRKRAGEWKEAARRAVAVGGTSDRNIQMLVDEILKNCKLSNCQSSY